MTWAPNDELRRLDPRVLARMEGLELRAKQIVEGYVSGMHRSPLHGFSQEFAEHREYAPGDDLRYVDWKVFGRTDKHYLKRFEEETNLICHVLLDVSRSMEYGSRLASMPKRAYAETAAAALTYLVLQQQDSVTLAPFSDRVHAIIGPSGRPSHLRHVLRAMCETPSGDDTDAGSVFHELAERFRKRGIVAVFSDLLDDIDRVLGGLRHFAHRRHEVILFHVLDPAELDFPFTDPLRFEGLEGGGRIAANPSLIRGAYLDQLGIYLRRCEAGARAYSMDYVRLRTDQPPEIALAGYLTRRARFRRGSAGGSPTP